MPEGTGKRQKLQFIGGTLRRKAEFFDAALGFEVDVLFVFLKNR